MPPTPGFGWRTFGVAVDGDGRADDRRATPGSTWLANEHLRVEVDPHTGTWSIRPPTACAPSGLGRLVEGGDGGDTYNYSPPAEDIVIDTPESVTVTPHESGPVRARS